MAIDPEAPQTAPGAARWDEVMPEFRQHWEQKFGLPAAQWERYEPRYRFGWEMAGRPEHRGKSWFDVQAQLREVWEAQHPDVAWDQAAPTIRDAYERTAGISSGA
jgi:hypothetical protein